MAIILKCPQCETKYRWEASREEAPEFCPNPDCGWDVKPKFGDDEVVMPFIRSAKTRSHDQVYRQMEAGSERRVELAAQAAGCSPAEMSSLKITNLNDRRDAEVAAMPVQNTVTQHMESMNQRGGQFGFSGGQGAEWAAGVAEGAVTIDGKVTKGVAPRAGATFIGKMQGIVQTGR